MRFFQGTVLTFFASICRVALGFGAGVLIARALGPAGRGQYNLAILIGGVMMIVLDFGFSNAVSYFASNRRFSSEQLLKNAFWASWVLGLLGLVIFVWLDKVGGVRILLGTEVFSPSILIVMIFLPTSFFSLYLTVLLLGEGKLLLYNLGPLVSPLVLLCAVGIQYYRHALTVNWAVFLCELGTVVSLLVMLFIRRHFLVSFAARFFRLRELKEIFSFSVFTHLGTIVQYLNFRLDGFIVNFFLGVGAVGIYTLSGSVAEVLWMISRPIGTILMPRVAASGNPKALGGMVFRSSALAFFLTVILALVAALAAPWVLPFVYGVKFKASVVPLFLLLPGATIFCFTNVHACYLTGIGKPQINTAISAVSLGATIGLDLLLIPRIGINGAAIASSISYTLTSVLTIQQTSKWSGVSPLELIKLPRRQEFQTVVEGLQSFTGWVRGITGERG